MTWVKRVQAFTFTVPALTTRAGFVSSNLQWGLNYVWGVSIRAPAGHKGTTGIRLNISGSYVLPWSSVGDWLTMDDESLAYDIDTEVGSLMFVHGYNTDATAHSFYLRFTYTPMSLMPALPSTAQIVAVV